MKRPHEYPELDLFYSESGENIHVEKVFWDEFPCEEVIHPSLILPFVLQENEA